VSPRAQVFAQLRQRRGADDGGSHLWCGKYIKQNTGSLWLARNYQHHHHQHLPTSTANTPQINATHQSTPPTTNHTNIKKQQFQEQECSPRAGCSTT
jgi:hypothetical protein